MRKQKKKLKSQQWSIEDDDETLQVTYNPTGWQIRGTHTEAGWSIHLSKLPTAAEVAAIEGLTEAIANYMTEQPKTAQPKRAKQKQIEL